MAEIRTTSRVALKLSCLQACNNDLERAARLFDYIADGLEGLPETDPPAPSGFAKVKSGADDVLAWIGSHRSEIEQGAQLLQTLRAKAPNPDLLAKTAVATLEEIPKL